MNNFLGGFELKDTFKIASVFIGTIVGAGLASGQEILQFFTRYGINSFYGILLCCLIYIIFSIIIVNLCFAYRYKSYKDIINSVLGPKLGWLVDISLTFFIFGGNTIMISGGGAMLKEYAGIDIFWGILLMAFISFLISAFSAKGVIAINAIIVPLSTSVILLLGAMVFLKGGNGAGISSNIQNNLPVKMGWMLSTILYSAFNLMGTTGVICPMTSEIKNRRAYIYGCTIGSIVLTFLAIIINYSILVYSPGSFYNEIPNLYISKKLGVLLPLVLTFVIWLEMLSTEISNLYSITKRLQSSFRMPYITCLLIIVLLSIPVSFLGFSNLIKLFYPPFGAVSSIFLVGCLFKFLKTRPNKCK